MSDSRSVTGIASPAGVQNRPVSELAQPIMGGGFGLSVTAPDPVAEQASGDILGIEEHVEFAQANFQTASSRLKCLGWLLIRRDSLAVPESDDLVDCPSSLRNEKTHTHVSLPSEANQTHSENIAAVKPFEHEIVVPTCEDGDHRDIEPKFFAYEDSNADLFFDTNNLPSSPGMSISEWQRFQMSQWQDDIGSHYGGSVGSAVSHISVRDLMAPAIPPKSRYSPSPSIPSSATDSEDLDDCAPQQRLAKHIREEVQKFGDYSREQLAPEFSNKLIAELLALRKAELIDHLVPICASYISYRAVQSRNEGETSGAPKSNNDRHSVPVKSDKQVLKRKVQDNEDNDGLSGDDDADRSRKRKKTESGKEKGLKRFACPFFKHDPQKYGHGRGCTGPGFGSIPRLKEHIYRCHQCPVFCQRCFESFENDEELTKHIRGEASCEVRERKVFDGITKEQQAALRSRKHLLFRGLSEEDQWRRIYRIIFPEAMDANTPSPFYDYDSLKPISPENCDAPTELQQFKDYVRREFAHRVRRELLSRLDAILQNAQSDLRDQIPTLFEDMHLGLVTDYLNETRGRRTNSTRQSSTTTDQSSSSSGQGLCQEEEEVGYEEPKAQELLEMLPLAFEKPAEHFDWIPSFDINDMLTWDVHDSGYQSEQFGNGPFGPSDGAPTGLNF